MTRSTRSVFSKPKFRDCIRALAQELGYTAHRVELPDERPLGEEPEGDGLLFGWEWTSPDGTALSPSLDNQIDEGLPGVNWSLFRSLGETLLSIGIGPAEIGSRHFVDTVRRNSTHGERLEGLVRVALAVCLCDEAKYMVLPEGPEWTRTHQIAWLRGWRTAAHQWLVRTGRWSTGPIVTADGETYLPDPPLVEHYLDLDRHG